MYQQCPSYLRTKTPITKDSFEASEDDRQVLGSTKWLINITMGGLHGQLLESLLKDPSELRTSNQDTCPGHNFIYIFFVKNVFPRSEDTP